MRRLVLVHQRPERPNATGHDQEDRRLLEAIASRRDPGAFARLYERYERDAYHLALHLTRDPEAAADTVQEAMLRIWKYAHSFTAPGSPRAWLLRIVAREGLRRGRSVPIRPGTFSEETDDTADVRDPATGQAVENRELLHSLRGKVERLPARDRQLLALYFGAGLSHQEIGKALSIPKRTVSHSIQAILNQLRRDLQKAGVASTIPLLQPETLRQTLLTGWAIPKELGRKVLAAAAASTPLQSRVPSVRAILIPLAFACIAAGVTALAPPLAPHPSNGPIENEPSLGATAARGQAAPASDQELTDREWVFDSPQLPPEIRVTRGRWRYVPRGSRERRGCLQMDGPEIELEIRIPIPRTALPILLRTEVCGMPSKKGDDRRNFFGEYVAWSAGYVRANLVNMAPPHTLAPFHWYPTSHFLSTRYCSSHFGGQAKPFHLTIADPDQGSTLRLLFIGAHQIRSISLRKRSNPQLPDVAGYLALYEQTPVERRRGVLSFPGLENGLGKDRPLQLRFRETRASAQGTATRFDPQTPRDETTP